MGIAVWELKPRLLPWIAIRRIEHMFKGLDAGCRGNDWLWHAHSHGGLPLGREQHRDRTRRTSHRDSYERPSRRERSALCTRFQS